MDKEKRSLTEKSIAIGIAISSIFRLCMILSNPDKYFNKNDNTASSHQEETVHDDLRTCILNLEEVYSDTGLYSDGKFNIEKCFSSDVEKPTTEEEIIDGLNRMIISSEIKEIIEEKYGIRNIDKIKFVKIADDGSYTFKSADEIENEILSIIVLQSKEEEGR